MMKVDSEYWTKCEIKHDSLLDLGQKTVTPALTVRVGVEHVLRDLPPLLYTDDEVEALCMPQNQSEIVRLAEREDNLRAALEAWRLPGCCAAFPQ